MLGDIDADQVTISATGAKNQPVSAAQLGFRGAFNYCTSGVSPKPSCSPPNNDGTDKPSWEPGTTTLVGTGQDTAGASAWFEPTVALNTVTFTYAQKSGSPVFQTWFSALAFNLTGTITRSDQNDQPVGQLRVDLYDPYGDLVSTTKTDGTGRYSFENQASYEKYRVEVERPTGLTSATLDRTVDLSSDNQVADFALRAVGPSPASGTVTDRETNEPVEDVTVHLRGPGNLERTTTTLADGSYLFDGVPDGDSYVVTIEVPDGFRDNPTEQPFSVPPDSDAPISGLDFDLVRVPSGEVVGTVTDTAGDPIENVLITLTGPDDQVYQLRTDRAGKYDLAGLEPGRYTITETTPDGDTVAGTASRTITVPTSGGEFVHRDFEILVPYSIDGDVLDRAGRPVPGATVTAKSSTGGAPQTSVTDSRGHFRLTGLPTGEWSLAVTPPAGYRAPQVRKVKVTDNNRTGITFTLTSSTEPSATPPSTPTSHSHTHSHSHSKPHSTPTRAPAGPTIAATGGPSVAPLVFGLAAALIGSFCLLIVGRRRSRGR